MLTVIIGIIIGLWVLLKILAAIVKKAEEKKAWEEKKKATELFNREGRPLAFQAEGWYKKCMTEYINKLNLRSVIVYEAYPYGPDSPDSGGVNIKFLCAKLGVQIKYIYFTIRGFNRVDDPIHPNNPDKEDIYQFNVTLKTTGPYPGKSPKSESALIEFIDHYKCRNSPSDYEYAVWNNIFSWQNPPEYIKIQKIRVVYKDNSEETIRNLQSLKDVFKQPIPKPPSYSPSSRPWTVPPMETVEAVEKEIAYLRSYLNNTPYYK